MARISMSIKLLWRHRSARYGMVIVLTFFLVALLAPWVAPHDPYAGNLPNRLKPPSEAHWVGTDELGRDVFSRIIFGSRISLQVGVIAVSYSMIGGGILGLLAGYWRGWPDSIIMRFMDVLLAFPSLLLALIFMAMLKPSLSNAMIAIGIASMPVFARVVRGQVLTLVERDFIEGARALGNNSVRIIFAHILPNALAPIIVLATLRVGTAILTEASLSYLGLGVPPPTASWGGLVASGQTILITAPWLSLVPGCIIFITVLGFNLLGDGVRDLMDPKLSGRRSS